MKPLIGKALGLTLSLATAGAGLALASTATAVWVPLAPRDPIGWVVISAGLGVFGIGASMTMIWWGARK